jgi:hypothetical protein
MSIQVYVVIDHLNNYPLGTFSTEAKAREYMDTVPNILTRIVEFNLDNLFISKRKAK